ncbi:DsbA family protein [Salinarimonas chemoclinalis]|uniref:DsbA family protein n=1 Tax=Salinarimonas chemoclinalis TaxID=3241599 RepID=UPI00355676E8
MITRRHALTLLAGASALGALSPRAAFAQSVDTELLETAGPLGEMALGDENAPVTVYEYASLTCGHCATFHNQTWPLVKERFVETGQVRLVMREFPLDTLALAGFMLARCEPAKYWGIVDMLFELQREWAFSERPRDALERLMRQAGFSQEKFEACLNDRAVYDAIIDVKTRGEQLGVNSTPTFFFNGEMRRGALTIDEFEAIVGPMLEG